MITKASGRLALLLAAGLWICGLYLAGSSQAVAGSDDAATPASAPAAPIALNKYTKPISHQVKKSAHPKSGDLAQKSADGKKAGLAEATADNSVPSVARSSAIPPSVANANAQLPVTDTLAGKNARAMSERANSIVQAASDTAPAAEVPIVSADQLNDLDRALQETPPPAASLAMASANVPVSANAPVMAAGSPLMATGSGNTTWDRTSLIGKIFIGFGVLLTMASAVRMFIA
jgi:hypothetical protein